MAKNSVAQYEVVAVGDEDGVQWRRGSIAPVASAAAAFDGVDD